MAQTNYTPISLYYSTTASATPSAGNLVNGELAINITDGKLYFKNNSGVVTLLAGSGGGGPAAGSNTQIQFNNSGVFGASANLTWDGTKVTSTGLSITGNTVLGDASADTVTVNGTITSNLIFTDNTYDIGASGATRPRNLFIAGNITAGGNQTLTGSLTVDSTTDSSSTTTGSIQTDGGVGIAKALYVGTTLDVNGGAQVTGSLSGYGGGEVRLGPTTANTQNGISTQATGTPAMLFDHRGTGNTGSFVWRNGTGGASTLMTIGGDGNLSLGPSGGAGRYVGINTDASTTGAFLYNDTNQTILSAAAAVPMIFRTSNTEAARILSNGTTLVGYTGGTFNDPGYNGAQGISLRSTADTVSVISASVGTPFYSYKYGAGSLFSFGYAASVGNSGVGISEIRTDGTNTTFQTTGATSLIFGTSNTERGRFTAGGNFGIATNAPQGLLQVGANGFGIILDNTISDSAPPSSGNDLYIFRGTNDGSMNFSARPGGGSVYRFWRGATTSMAINNGGQVVINNGTTPLGTAMLTVAATAGTGSNVCLTLQTGVTTDGYGAILFRNQAGQQGAIVVNTDSIGMSGVSAITFKATQVPSADANTLDDYEEGTWTPNIAFGGASVGVTYNATYNRGWYTRVGRLVTCTMALEVQSKGSSTGDLVIGGFPFSSTLGDASVSHALSANNITVTSGPLSAYGTLFSGVLAVVRQVSGGAQVAITNSDCGSSFSILGTIVYLV